MKQSFHLLLIIILVLVAVISCSKQEIKEIQKEVPVIPPIEEPPFETDSNEVQCARLEPSLLFFVIDKDSNGIIDTNYPQTQIQAKGKVGIKKAYYIDDYPFRVDSITIEYPPFEDGFISINTGFNFSHEHFFTETKDSVAFTSTYKLPILEYYTKIGVDWTNGDVDTFTIRFISACFFVVNKIIYKDSIIQNSDYGGGSACLVKEVQ